MPLVNIDNIQGAYSALRYLYNKGHRKVLYVRGPSHIAASLEREKGIKKFLNRHPDMEVFIPDKWGGFNPEDGYRQIKEHLRKYGKNFTAIFVVNDYSTLGVYEALMESGLEIPDDVSVLGFDDAPFSKYIYPPLTTVAQPRWEMGTTAAQLLIDRISTQKVKVPRNVVLPTRIVERKSVKELKT
ncbi:MAG: LacI family transcriptional regulator [Thermotogota bacterium]|nr:LacI family transcriptional regulator [Thermotogota bacterium]